MCLGRGPLPGTLNRVWSELGIQGRVVSRKSRETVKENIFSLPYPTTVNQHGVSTRTSLGSESKAPWGPFLTGLVISFALLRDSLLLSDSTHLLSGAFSWISSANIFFFPSQK